MASRRRKPRRPSARGVGAAPRDADRADPWLRATAPFAPTLEALLEHAGQISIGTIGPIACAAVASDPHNMLAALVRRPNESLTQLIERLDRAVMLALEHDTFTDEIDAPSNRSR